MSTAETTVVAVNLLDRSYNIKCPAAEAQALQQAASYLDQHMRQLTQSNGHVMSESMAVVAALNMTNELLTVKRLAEQNVDNVDDVNQWIENLAQNIASALETKQPVAV